MCVGGVTSMFFITADGRLFPFLGRALVLDGENEVSCLIQCLMSSLGGWGCVTFLANEPSLQLLSFSFLCQT